MSTANDRPVALTMGDPAGIGPEIVAKAYREAPLLLQGSLVVGDLACMRRAAAWAAGTGIALPVVVLETPQQALRLPQGCIPLWQTGQGAPLPAVGRIDPVAGRMAVEAVQWAARAALRGEIAAVVTAPINKAALAAAGLRHPGHTEMLQAEAAAHAGVGLPQMPVRMMLANRELRTVLLSIHLSLRDAIAAVTHENLLTTLQIAARSLTSALGRSPRMAVAGLNPHAGEGGLFGREELEVIAPAVAAAREQGLDVHGPFAPDTVFMRARAGEFDLVVAMYHDQGLIPVKYLGVEQGVNVTLGLPLVRTSPDHGTAFDLAGTGRASAASLLEAVRVARELSGART